jgi:hypothetical protein
MCVLRHSYLYSGRIKDGNLHSISALIKKFNEDQSLSRARLKEVESLVEEAKKLDDAIQSFINAVATRRTEIKKHDSALDSCSEYAQGKLFSPSGICYYNLHQARSNQPSLPSSSPPSSTICQ